MTNTNTGQATVSNNGASSAPTSLHSSAEAVAQEPAPSAATTATGAASVPEFTLTESTGIWRYAAAKIEEINEALRDMTDAELDHVADFIDRMVSVRNAE